MAETSSNIEFAHKIHEQGHHHQPAPDGRAEWVEILEAVVLAVVAVATAWSGYQAAKWDALSAEHYNRALRLNVEAQALSALAGQDRLYDIITANGWLNATAAGDGKLASYYERRFRPEYVVAADAFRKLDPEHNPSAPPGAIFMPEYVNEKAQRSQALAAEATGHFEQGVTTRETGDQYVKITVLLATVLLLSALSQRFRVFGPRVAVLGVASILLVVSLYAIATFPRVLH